VEVVMMVVTVLVKGSSLVGQLIVERRGDRAAVEVTVGGGG
jgi:hypothetical protein